MYHLVALSLYSWTTSGLFVAGAVWNVSVGLVSQEKDVLSPRCVYLNLANGSHLALLYDFCFSSCLNLALFLRDRISWLFSSFYRIQILNFENTRHSLPFSPTYFSKAHADFSKLKYEGGVHIQFEWQFRYLSLRQPFFCWALGNLCPLLYELLLIASLSTGWECIPGMTTSVYYTDLYEWVEHEG